ncbi:glycerol-3-phosphate ABC transporter ATP-binding protein [Haloferax sp. Atlit-12N]|uniref:ABC transporter ATP-binding protein n=1 Tax=Haloferax sp. Atlit-12N TaxID=2077203 RepID=UPI000E24D1CC|nr:ABC transporter ATP-binding protein [Haloferax sp. Atlit-12N]RDZ62615.1 glycerol-3-phosphate ABC transporter ATP-binding protein [Haloferax sp. Atlit-12N]
MSKTDTLEVDQTNESINRSETFLKIDGLTKVYDDGGSGVVAVDDMNIDIKEGEFIVFVGPSGCGKSTTLRSVAGLEEITEGQIVINGENVEGQPPRQRDIAMVFQSYALYPHMTVRENMEYPLKVRGVPKEERERRVEESAALLEIPELLDRQPKDLSGGQQQRVALGRAIVREPRVFLFDEPLSNLDAKLRVQMRTELNKLHNKIGKTSIYVTHDQAEAMTLSDRVVVMNDGEVQQIAPPQQVYDQPANEFVGGFMGSPSMNFFDATVNTETEEITTDAFTIPLPEWMQEELDRTGEFDARFGVRPEDITVDRQKAGETDTSHTTVDVVVVEEMGSNFFLTVENNNVEYKAIVEPDANIERGDALHLDFNLDKCHLFDAATGDTLVYEIQR